MLVRIDRYPFTRLLAVSTKYSYSPLGYSTFFLTFVILFSSLSLSSNEYTRESIVERYQTTLLNKINFLALTNLGRYRMRMSRMVRRNIYTAWKRRFDRAERCVIFIQIGSDDNRVFIMTVVFSIDIDTHLSRNHMYLSFNVISASQFRIERTSSFSPPFNLVCLLSNSSKKYYTRVKPWLLLKKKG